MRLNKHFIPVVTLFSFLILLLIYLLFISGVFGQNIFLSSVLGVSIPLNNFLLGFLSIRFSINKTHSVFLIIFFGGMIIRLFLMLTFVFLVLKFLENIAYSFIFIVFIFYSFYLLTEILYLNQLRSK